MPAKELSIATRQQVTQKADTHQSARLVLLAHVVEQPRAEPRMVLAYDDRSQVTLLALELDRRYLAFTLGEERGDLEAEAVAE